MSHIATLNSFNRFIVCLSFLYWDHNEDIRLKCIRYDKCLQPLLQSVLDMLSRSAEVLQEPAVAVAVAVVGHNRRKDELPALALLLVSHLVVVGLHRHEFVHQLCHLLHVVLLVKHAAVKNSKDLFPPGLLDIVLDDAHHLDSVFLLIK